MSLKMWGVKSKGCLSPWIRALVWTKVDRAQHTRNCFPRTLDSSRHPCQDAAGPTAELSDTVLTFMWEALGSKGTREEEEKGEVHLTVPTFSPIYISFQSWIYYMAQNLPRSSDWSCLFLFPPVSLRSPGPSGLPVIIVRFLWVQFSLVFLFPRQLFQD